MANAGGVDELKKGECVSYVMQYHNADDNGLTFGLDRDNIFGDGEWMINTKRSFVKKEVGSTCFMIVGIGKPRRYYLWNVFTIEKVEEVEDVPDAYAATGKGWMLNPPQLLKGKEFEEFQHHCANFASFKNISELAFTRRMKHLAEKFHRLEWDEKTLDFCNELVEFAFDYPHVHMLRGLFLWWLKENDQAIEDFSVAQQMLLADLPFAEDAVYCTNAIMELDYDVETTPASEDMAEVYSQIAIRQRRGPEEFREQLLEAYSGKCAITGCDAASALEAAHISLSDGEHRNEISNGLLLRTDVHTLFDLNLIAIHPEHMTVVLAPELEESSYASLEGVAVNLPSGANRPNLDCVLRRWEHFLKAHETLAEVPKE